MNRPVDPPPPYYRHKTASIPPEAHARLSELRKMVAQPGVQLSDGARSFLNEQMSDNAEKYTYGLVFWLAVEIAIADVEARNK